MRLRWICVLLLALMVVPAAAQDGLNLPTELYVLLNDGVVQRYGLGTEGIQTVTPEGEFVLDMAIAPDGQWLAYRTEAGLMLVNVFSGDISQLEGPSASVPPMRGRGDTMAWSPSGDMLVYTTLYGLRVYHNAGGQPVFSDVPGDQLFHLNWSPDGSYLAGETENNIWWVFRRDASTLTLASAISSSVDTAWVGPSELVFVPEKGGLLVMDMAQRNLQTPILDDDQVYLLPFQMPDGSLLVYSLSQREAAAQEQRSGHLTSVNLQANHWQQEGDELVDLTGVRWGPDGSLLLAFRGGVLALVNRRTGDGLTLPVTGVVAYTWGRPRPQGVSGVNLPADGFFLATDTSGADQVWRIPSDSTPPVLLTAAQAGISAFAVSRDQRSLAYVSQDTLWWFDLRGTSEPVELAEAPGAQELAFSPDGGRVAYVLPAGDEGSPGGIWIVSTAGGDSEQVLVDGEGGSPGYRLPAFAPNVNALLVVMNSGDAAHLGLLDLNTSELIDLGAYDAGHWLGSGRIVAYGDGSGGLNPAAPQRVYIISTDNLAEPTEVASVDYPLRIASIAETPQRLLRMAVYQAGPGPSELRVIDVPSGGGVPIMRGSAGFIAAPVLAPDGKVIVGYTHPGGALVVFNPDTGERLTIQEPIQLSHFRWGAG